MAFYTVTMKQEGAIVALSRTLLALRIRAVCAALKPYKISGARPPDDLLEEMYDVGKAVGVIPKGRDWRRDNP